MCKDFSLPFAILQWSLFWFLHFFVIACVKLVFSGRFCVRKVLVFRTSCVKWMSCVKLRFTHSIYFTHSFRKTRTLTSLNLPEEDSLHAPLLQKIACVTRAETLYCTRLLHNILFFNSRKCFFLSYLKSLTPGIFPKLNFREKLYRTFFVSFSIL